MTYDYDLIVIGAGSGGVGRAHFGRPWRKGGGDRG